jgi:hypothetical protein
MARASRSQASPRRRDRDSGSDGRCSSNYSMHPSSQVRHTRGAIARPPVGVATTHISTECAAYPTGRQDWSTFAVFEE